MISLVQIGGFVEMDRVLFVYASYWFEGQGVFLEQELCSKPTLKV